MRALNAFFGTLGAAATLAVLYRVAISVPTMDLTSPRGQTELFGSIVALAIVSVITISCFRAAFPRKSDSD
jgi:hypothetical protein